MSVFLGIDVGAVGVKVAILVPADKIKDRITHAAGSHTLLSLDTDQDAEHRLLALKPHRTQGRPLLAVQPLLETLAPLLQHEPLRGLCVTGSGSALLADALDVPTCNEFQATARAVDRLHPDIRTVFEIGGETSRYLRLLPDPASGTLGITDYSTNGDCAAGTGAFMDQQAGRLQYRIEEIASVVAEADRAASIAGRCSVFAKSDMIHAQQKGYLPAEVLRGLCNAVATNFRSAVVKGHIVEPPILLIGGVAANRAIVDSLHQTFALNPDDVLVPQHAAVYGAAGAALAAAAQPVAADNTVAALLERLSRSLDANGHAFPMTRPLSLDNVTLLRDRVRPYTFASDGQRIDAFLGLDIGSVGTKLVLIDEQGEVIHSIFTRTEGRPIQVVTRALRELEEAVGWGVRIKGVGSTGSGRELIGELVGADSINDEITAHKTGATFVGDRLLGKRPDTIFEIGGQDSKYISLEPDDTAGTVVVDFTMNEACAAGTGSFLEERADELGVSIKGEFAAAALRSKAPLRLGERCTVFMERDVNTYMQRGAKRDDVIAGLAYSIAHNYINRVVRGRHIGDCIFFQGGTAYNDAVAAAFSIITGKEIIVPPHNAVLGAIGAALLAREKIQTAGLSTRFRGYDLKQVDYDLREFTCKGCGNLCAIQEFTVEGEKTFWGDKCSDRYRKQAKTERKPVVPDLVKLRTELLHADDAGDPPNPRATIGIPLAMYTWDLLPLYRRFFRDCGFAVTLSTETNRNTIRRGLDAVVAEPCFPIIVAHGHIAELVERNVDHIWLPNILSTSDKHETLDSHVCPWGSTLPFVARQAPPFRQWQGRMLCPTLEFHRGREAVRKQMLRVAKDLGVRRKVADQAFAAAERALQQFRTDYRQVGRDALETLERTNETGMVLVGRPYNMHDAGVSLATARKLREQYGVNLLPVDALPTDDIVVDDINDAMYWAYGRRILAAAKLVRQHPNLHMIYITNFKCGPDSFIKGFIRDASGKPFLTLQFDGHSNDAGMMTRCEAYLDSKGILRWWRTCQTKPSTDLCRDEHSTSPRCPTAAPG